MKKVMKMIKAGIVWMGLLLIFPGVLPAQTKYFTREGKVEFNSQAPLENITAINKKGTSVLDTETGNIEFSILMRAFEFEKALMQEHFNENYVESDKYPKAVFKGTIENNSGIKWKEDGTYPARVVGTMTIHGVTQNFTAEGKFLIKGGEISASSEFDIVVEDYKISIPKIVREKIAKVVNVKVDFNYEPLMVMKG